MACKQTEHEDPRVTRTRELIEKAFYELLMEKSLHTLTIGDITDRARINRATFYAHFEDKYDLYRHMVRNTFQQIFLKTLDDRWDDREAQLRAVVRAACLFFQELNATCPPADRRTRPLVEIEVQQQIYGYLLCWLEQGTNSGVSQPAPLALTAKMASWAIFGAGLDWEGPYRSVDALAEQIYGTIAMMLGVPQPVHLGFSTGR